MAEESGGEPRREAGCGIGARLHDARERAGLTVAQAAQRLHVASEVIEALETEQFDALGAPIYVRSYLGRYAELLGESAEALKERLNSAVVIPEPDLTRIPRGKVEDNRYVTTILIVVAVAVAVLIAWWTWSRWHRLVEPLSVSHPTVAQPASRVEPPAPSQSPRPARPRRSASTAPPANTHDSSVVAAHALPATGTLRMTLQFPAASWLAVTDATGRGLYRGMVPAGATKTFQGKSPAHVVLGYATGVTLKVNGHIVPIDAQVEHDHAASIDVSADGRVTPAPRSSGE